MLESSAMNERWTHTPKDPADVDLMELFRLDGRVAVVTGAGRGIGRGIALGLADAGADVVITARRRHELDEVAERIAARGTRAIIVGGDITAEDTIPRCVEAATKEAGQLDVWVS